MTDYRPPAGLPAGYDPDDPYEETDLDSLPEWWRRNVEVHRAHDMCPYRPPRFADGAPVPPVVDELERELGVEVALRGFAAPKGDADWCVWVDGERVASVDHTRTESGASRYGLDVEEFRRLVREAVGESEATEE